MVDFDNSRKAAVSACTNLKNETIDRQWISKSSVYGVQSRGGCQGQFDWDLASGVETTCLSLPLPQERQSYIDKQHQVNQSLSNCIGQIPKQLYEGTFEDGTRHTAVEEKEPFLSNAKQVTEQNDACVKQWTEQTRSLLSKESRAEYATSTDEKIKRGGCKSD